MLFKIDNVSIQMTQKEAAVIYTVLANILEEDPLGATSDALYMGISEVDQIYSDFKNGLSRLA